ncbi:MAG: signal peptide peptidase SppA [Verrucomicrobiota bacterium]
MQEPEFPSEPSAATVPPRLDLPPRFHVPPAPRGGSAWRWVAVVLGLGLAASLGANLLLSAGKLAHAVGKGGHGRHGDAALQEVVIEDNGSKDKVVVVDIDGVISGEAERGGGPGMVDSIRDQLDRAADDDQVKAVVLRVDSPGGEVLASDEIYRAISAFQTNHDIPVIASMGSVAASGGYYVSAPCRWIVANELTITGSIGVIFHTYNYRGLMDKIGVVPSVVKSGKLKDMLSPDKRPEDELPEERAILKDMIDESYAKFRSIIVAGRSWAARQNAEDKIEDGRKLQPGWIEHADGRILSGTKALELGLVDELGDFDTAVDRAMGLAGLEKANLVSYQAPIHFSDLFRWFGKTDARAQDIRVDLGGFGLQPRLPQGRLYFISPVHVH